jgi:hypothetical protein
MEYYFLSQNIKKYTQYVIYNMNMNTDVLLCFKLFQAPVLFTQPAEMLIDLPNSLPIVTKIKLQLECSTGDICDEVEAKIRGCLRGKCNFGFFNHFLVY